MPKEKDDLPESSEQAAIVEEFFRILITGKSVDTHEDLSVKTNFKEIIKKLADSDIEHHDINLRHIKSDKTRWKGTSKLSLSNFSKCLKNQGLDTGSIVVVIEQYM